MVLCFTAIAPAVQSCIIYVHPAMELIAMCKIFCIHCDAF